MRKRKSQFFDKFSSKRKQFNILLFSFPLSMNAICVRVSSWSATPNDLSLRSVISPRSVFKQSNHVPRCDYLVNFSSHRLEFIFIWNFNVLSIKNFFISCRRPINALRGSQRLKCSRNHSVSVQHNFPVQIGKWANVMETRRRTMPDDMRNLSRNHNTMNVS